MGKKRARGEIIPSWPLKKRLDDLGYRSRADFCRQLDISQAILTNWLNRGTKSIPGDRFGAVCAFLGISESEYRREAGLSVSTTKAALRQDEATISSSDILRKLDQIVDLLREALDKFTIGLNATGRSTDERAQFVHKSSAKVKHQAKTEGK